MIYPCSLDLFLIYINDLSDDLYSYMKLPAHNISLFPIFHDKSTSGNKLRSDLKKRLALKD